ncbi:hypothetical protein WHR41_06532 [Cladosporium halotolerans]|uniref:DUF218 domain-containing protein n=1 Tax=Cladosporium halotolerans TaxID=1052096 RepID=A0AB34KM51_9PEZI
MSKIDGGKNVADDINIVSHFLAFEQIKNIQTHNPVDCIVICASSVLYQASHVFSALEKRPSLAKNLVLVGGIGHSTSLIYEAVERHPTFHAIKDHVTGLPEAQVLLQILERFFDLDGIENNGCRVLIEDRSTNCGANAVETRKVLEGVRIPDPGSCIFVQDPTMSLRTLASFEKAYGDLPVDKRPRFSACPVIVPRMRMEGEQLEYVLDESREIRKEDMWETKRFCELLVGEVARLTDDENGYGPRGKGFIGHVDVPVEVQEAAKKIRERLGVSR